jgi:hypothetical protein
MLIISIFVFCLVLFLYIHVYFHLKQSNDLEVYEIDQPSKQRLEEVCDIRQPTTFYYCNDQLLYLASYNSIYSNYRAFDIQMRDISNSISYLNDSQITTDANELYIPVALKVANEVFKNDKESKYLSENNAEFIEETGVLKLFQVNDEFLRPYMVSNCFYDFMIASTGTHTPLRYELNYRNYFLVTQGRVTIRLIPPKYSKYLFPVNDYENFEFISPVNPWKVQEDYQNEFDKLKTLDVELTSGMMLYIPAYWWYSIKFMEASTSVCSFKYRTYMSSISILPKLCMKVLQNHNIKRETIKKHTFIPTPGETVMKTEKDESTHIPEKTPHTYETNDGTTDISTLNYAHQSEIPKYGDQLLPSSLRSTNNPFALATISENGPNNIGLKDNERENVNIISAALSTQTTLIGNAIATNLPSGEMKSITSEVILTNDAIQTTSVKSE